MVFASLEFLTLFLPLFLAVYALTPQRARNLVLLLGSWVFYSWLKPVYLLLLVGITVLAWAGALAIEPLRQGRYRRVLLTAALVLNVATLCWFKYSNILASTISDIAEMTGALPQTWERVALPAGLSFFVLQAISYLVDVYRREVRAERNFIDFVAYKAMFGQLIAGPIIRWSWVDKEMARRTMDWQNFCLGARRFMIGMSMKVLIADTLAPVADAAFALHEPTLADAWIGCAAYSLQLFFDFAGYSAMAIGLGLMMGFHLPENFNNPYLARSIQDFWRRWHLSLSSWIRDYLYIPMGGNRRGVWKTYRNLLLTMGIAGLWHGGESWNFLLWGLAHGVALAVARAWNANGLPAVPAVLSRLLTLLFVMLAWTLFRAADFHDALAMYRGQFGLNGLALGDVMHVTLRPAHALAAALGVVCIVLPVWQSWWAAQPVSRLRVIWSGLWPVVGFLLAYALIASRGAVPFLYFQF
ncbi:MBOAT family O-acyltransferase [Bordetella avium]|uniref:MBOAT family O-acyltransferase n=1 Tax=Bordetella avium TaxID=521 RepID=UPI000E694E69|nr:MBOAT family protein [Bordetella avium]RIQ58708.1 MBOAT family protein [Bordetella avium]